jgi:hypothetical protein
MIGNREEDEEEALDSQRHEEEETAAEEEDAGGNTTAIDAVICNETQDPNLPSCCSNHTKKIHQKNSQISGMILCIKASNGLPNSDVKTRNLKSRLREQMRARFSGD